MKTLLLPFAVAAFFFAPEAQAQEATPNDIAFSVKSYIKVENHLTVGIHEKPSLDNSVLQVKEEATKTVMNVMTPVLTKANDSKLPRDPARLSLAILQAAKDLADVAKRLGVGQPGMAINMNFVIYPTNSIHGDDKAEVVSDGSGDENDSFSKFAVHNIEFFKRSKFGRVLDGKLPVLPIAAAVSFRLNGLDGEARLQLVNLVNPQYVDGPNPIEIPEVKSAKDATVMFFEVAQPLKLTMPVIDLKFGKVGNLQRQGWILRFDPSNDESMCSRASSAPTLWQKKGIWMPLPLYHVKIDLNKSDKIVDADVRLGLLGMCTGAFGVVRSEFLKQANKQMADAQNMALKLVGASPEELSEMIARDRRDSGLERLNPDDEQ